ncbi:MAG TPA: TonB family protein [Opitutaceae bacterium]|nr:TonB family protein [Opitutaceae bacterium]
MNPRISPEGPLAAPPWLVQEAVGLVAGVVFTFGIFSALAHLDVIQPPAPAADITDLVTVPLLFEAPAPPPPAPAEPAEAVRVPLTGIEAGPGDSPVRIAVVPPELAAIFPASAIPPPGTIELGRLFPDLAPKAESAVDLQRVYLRSEVDRRPTVLVREEPRIPERVRQNAPLLRVTLLILVDRQGQVVNVRLLQSSGNPEFDRIVSESVKNTWTFTPAIKQGKAVRCLAEQLVTVKWSPPSPFEVSR